MSRRPASAVFAVLACLAAGCTSARFSAETVPSGGSDTALRRSYRLEGVVFRNAEGDLCRRLVRLRDGAMVSRIASEAGLSGSAYGDAIPVALDVRLRWEEDSPGIFFVNCITLGLFPWSYQTDAMLDFTVRVGESGGRRDAPQFAVGYRTETRFTPILGLWPHVFSPKNRISRTALGDFSQNRDKKMSEVFSGAVAAGLRRSLAEYERRLPPPEAAPQRAPSGVRQCPKCGLKTDSAGRCLLCD